MKFQSFITISLLSLVLISCEYEFPTPPEEPVQGAENADLSNTLFLGGTRFSGVFDGGYSSNTTLYNLPNLILKNGKLVAADAVVGPQPNISSSFNIYLNSSLNGNSGNYEVFFPSLDTTVFKRRVAEGGPLSFSNQGTSIENAIGLPGLGILDITQSNSANIYLSSFYPSLSGSLMSAVSQSTPSFVIIDAGFEDILNFSLNGAAGNAEVTDPALMNAGDLPSEELFRAELERLVSSLISANTKGALLNIPSILQFPMFSRVEYDLTPYINGKPILSTVRSQANTLNAKLLAYYRQNPNTPDSERRPLFDFAGDNAGNWGIVNEDPTLAEVNYNGEELPKVRHALNNEYFIYKNENALRTGYGARIDNPVPHTSFITAKEATLIKQKIQAYNQIIASVVANSGGNLILVDTQLFFDNLFEGYDRVLNNAPEGTTVDGVFYEPLISDSGMFTADGLNLNPAGTALLGNLIIDSINQGFGGNLKRLNPNSFPGTNFQLEQ